MKIFQKLFMPIILPLVTACSGQHLINDTEYMKLVDSSFKARKELAANRYDELFSVFDQSLSERQTEALKFLFAFMPLSDLADYDGRFFLANVNISLKAMDESPWGKNIPEEIFLHYVLPCRVNNENLDSFRIVYYDEIKSRVKSEDIVSAALEINHWCHEKVAYQAADIRTSAPMSTILSARGRCGEESTFTVAALRTAGIPARQVYTPRWAHTDDNHAWVEVWSEGKWYYMGACEPEPVIDRGWFTEPARRAMLIHTKSFGASETGENAVCRTPYFTEVNNLSKYAVTKKIVVKVTDHDNRPVHNAKVEYQLYNYAEFYPLAEVSTDENGISQFETGLGDLLVWASDKEVFNYQKISVGETDTLKLELNKIAGESYSIDLDLDVPVALSPLPGPSQEMIDSNAKKINAENVLRRKYIDSWKKPGETKSFAIERNIDTTRVIDVFARSMGNYKEIRSFLSDTPDSLIDLALSLLELLPDKDLRDCRGMILSDHLLNSSRPLSKTKDGDRMFIEFVLNPRVANEMIVPWRSYFRHKLPPGLINDAPANPLLISDYLERNITLDDKENYYRTPLTPIGVNDLKVSDSFSRDICFVAICRSLGIPSRLEPGSNIPQYFLNSVWNDLYFSERAKPDGKKGYIKLISNETKPVPEYYIHFTLARFENGRYNTLEYDFNKKVTDFTDELILAPGSYLLVTGNRTDSKILSILTFFELSEGEHKTVEVKIRKDIPGGRIIGKIDLKEIVSLIDKPAVNPERIIENGVVVLWIAPESEPTRHVLNDFQRLKKDLDSWDGYFLFLTDPSAKWGGFTNEELKKMPAKIFHGNDNAVLNRAFKSFDPPVMLPFVILADRNGNIRYASSGYRIGTGEQLLRFTRE